VDKLKKKKLSDCIDFLGRGQSPTYIDGESDAFAINQKCVRNGMVSVMFSRAHDPRVTIKGGAKLRAGDICINSTGTGTIGRIGLWQEQASNGYITYFADSHVTIARPRKEEINSKFLAALLESASVQNVIETYCLSGSTNQVELNRQAVGELELSLLTKPEQDLVATILSAIDKAIEQTEAIIAKQQRIKTGLMQDLLTRGIDEHGNIRSEETHKFKDSQLGRIPVEWDCQPLVGLAAMQVGFAFKSPWFQTEGVRLLRGENVGYGRPDWDDAQYLSASMAEEYAEYMLRTGDIVIGMDRTFTKQGCKISIMCAEDTPSLLVQRVGRFIPASVSPGYLRAVLASKRYQDGLLLHQKGMDIPHLSKDEILSPFVPVPEGNERERIGRTYETLENRLELERRTLKKLTSLKSGLIQDLLTGKVRVTRLLRNLSVRKQPHDYPRATEG
jgi:type I restriction enzyme S subunit